MITYLIWSLLALIVASCWIGALGMWRMSDPTQALHYLALPAAVGAALLVIAVFLKCGNTEASWKTLLTAFILLAINSVVTHASARAFRTRTLGHWEPRKGDPIEHLHSSRSGARE